MYKIRLVWKFFVFVCVVKHSLAGIIDENEVKTWVSNFKQNLDGHINNVLAIKEIENNFTKYNKDLVITKINGSEVFSSIFQKVSIRYTELESALTYIKASIERPVTPSASPTSPGAGQAVPTPSGAGPPPLVPPGPVAPSLTGSPPLAPPGVPVAPPIGLSRCCAACSAKKYDGRFREEICDKECYENMDELLRSIASLGLADTFKRNLKSYPAITWQYFADDVGHFVLYPTSDRQCDKTSKNISSPLLQDWFVEKLHMERKNLVILLDNGISTEKAALPGKPQTKREIMKDAVVRSLGTLTDNDKVNIVAFPSQGRRTEVLGPCNDTLYVATDNNKNNLVSDLQKLPADTSEPNLQEGLKNVYQILEKEKHANPASFEQCSNIVLIVMNGESKPFGIDEKQILEMIAREQVKLNHSVQHFVYTLGRPKNKACLERLAQIADQNNLKLNSSSGIAVKPWPQISVLVGSNLVVGKEGLLDIVSDPLQFPTRVATYFQRLPPQIDSERTLIAPRLDPKLGVSMTLAQPVYNLTSNQVLGVAAVDASIATVFSEIANFDIGENSYAFLFETSNGKVILHPKLRDPDETRKEETIFPTLDLLEPDLSSGHIQTLQRASNKMQHFDTQVHDIQFLSIGETSISRQPLPVTMYYQLIGGTRLCVVVVHILVDSEEAKKQKDQLDVKLHAPYHRIDALFGSPEGNQPAEVCALERHFVSFKESVIKLSPSVFKTPETYKYSLESVDNITVLNKFLTSQTVSGTGLIRKDLESLIQHTVRSTQYLDTLWTSTAKEVIERFYGTPTGVFRVYPGIPLPNSYDHLKSECPPIPQLLQAEQAPALPYAKVVGRPGTGSFPAPKYLRSLSYTNRTVYHRGILSWANRQDVIVVSRALTDYTDYRRLQGVLGMTVTPRFLSSLLVKGAKDCYASDKTCHIVDDKGDIIDSFLEVRQKRHISAIYPWLAEILRKQHKMKVDWCTGFSDDYHKMTFTLDQVDSSDVTNGDQCQQYKLQHIPDTNIHLLVLANRTSSNCKDLAITPCFCPPTTGGSLPQCQYCYGNLGDRCQCECSCDTDFDQCQDTFSAANVTSFPKQACFYQQLETIRQDLLPDVPSPGVPHCPIPCVAVENTTLCEGLHHCKLSQETYPTCIWKRDDEYNSSDVSYFFPTPTPKPPPTPPPAVTKSTKTQVLHSSGPPTPPVRPQQTTSTQATGPPSHTPTLVTNPSQTAGPPTLKPPGTKPPPPASKGSTISHSKSTRTAISTSIESHMTMTNPVSHVTSLPMAGSSSNKTSGSEIATTSGMSSTESLSNPDEDKDSGLSPGGIAAIVIAIIAVALIAVFIVIKLYGKKFRRPGADESSKYLQGSSMFDSTLFNRSQDTVTIGSAPPSTIPYQEM